MTSISLPTIPFVQNKNFLDGVATYRSGLWKCYGWLLSLIGRAICVYDNQKSFYIHRAGLIEKLTASAHFHPSVFSGSGSVTQRVMEFIDPLIGRKIQLKKIQELFEDFQNKDFLRELRAVKEMAYAKEIIKERIERLKNRHLQILDYDASELARVLKPGDLIFKKIHETNSHIVVTGQKLLQPFTRGLKEREGYKYSHVALYIGNGKIAEAVPHHAGCDVRILRLDDPRFSLDRHCKNQYLISRPCDESLATEAADVAAKVAVEAVPIDEKFENETPFKYDKIKAFRSIWHPSGFGPFARYRYLKQYIDDHKHQLPRDFIGLKTFFCSYFAGYCYQTAESRRIMPKLLGENDGPPTGLTQLDSAVFRGLWARLRRIQVWGQMSKHVKMQFDAKRMTPQDLRNFILRNPDLFKDRFLIQAARPGFFQNLSKMF